MSRDKPLGELDAFFEWVRARTESAWKRVKEPSLEEFGRARVGGDAWRRGTTWRPFEESGVEVAERHFGAAFPGEHRRFLRTLGATTPRRFAARSRGAELVGGDAPGFYDWRTEAAEVRRVVEGAIEGSGVAGTSVPRPIPVIGHRFVVPAGNARGYVVLSIVGEDVIVYASDLRRLLLLELAHELGVGPRARGEAVDAADVETARAIPGWGRLL